MTIVVAFYCSDGVVIGADSMLTPSMGNIAVGHHNARKVEVLSGDQIYAFAGDLGQAHRFRIMAEHQHPLRGQARHALDYPITLTQNLIAQFNATGIGSGAIGVNTVLAFCHGAAPHCCVFEGAMQPRLLDQNHYYVALGSGKLSGDPFLRFLVDTFCSAPPTIREAIFLTTWAIQHVIETNPGGVAGPIRIAVLESANNQRQARELPIDEIAEHQQAVESARSALRTWRDRLQSGAAADDAPEPPKAPAGGAPTPAAAPPATSAAGQRRASPGTA
jgi:20S proteasome alpha/beta subunit